MLLLLTHLLLVAIIVEDADNCLEAAVEQMENFLKKGALMLLLLFHRREWDADRKFGR
jgi:hypothetical protein